MLDPTLAAPLRGQVETDCDRNARGRDDEPHGPPPEVLWCVIFFPLEIPSFPRLSSPSPIAPHHFLELCQAVTQGLPRTVEGNFTARYSHCFSGAFGPVKGPLSVGLWGLHLLNAAPKTVVSTTTDLLFSLFSGADASWLNIFDPRLQSLSLQHPVLTTPSTALRQRFTLCSRPGQSIKSALKSRNAPTLHPFPSSFSFPATPFKSTSPSV